MDECGVAALCAWRVGSESLWPRVVVLTPWQTRPCLRAMVSQTSPLRVLQVRSGRTGRRRRLWHAHAALGMVVALSLSKSGAAGKSVAQAAPAKLSAARPDDAGSVPSSDRVRRSQANERSRVANAQPVVDYNASKPNAALLDHGKALANLAFQNWLIWQANWFRRVDWVPVTRSIFADNLQSGFTFDQDELQTNFFGHPYHGGLMFNSSRAVGLGFWESIPYTFVGSLTWELFGEKEPPSTNDLLVTTLAGIILGEITHRLSSELLDDRTSGGLRLLRELAAAAVSPMRGLTRVYTHQAFAEGHGVPRRHPVAAELQVGVERVRARRASAAQSYSPALLLAMQIDYGEWGPGEGGDAGDRLEPFEFFYLYAALNLLQRELAGGQVHAAGLLYGWRLPLSRPAWQHVFGFNMTYEFQSSHLATYAGVGLGPTNYLQVKLGRGRFIRVGLGLDIVPILGVTHENARSTTRSYDFGAGGAVWGSLHWSLARAGDLRLRTRHYATTVLGAEGGADYVGVTRMSYEVDVFDPVGVGIAPVLIYNRRIEGAADASTLQLQAQLYLRAYL